MAYRRSQVLAALERWTRKGLLDEGQARVLEEEQLYHDARRGRRFAQLVVGATGGVVFVVAAGAFLTWTWPELGPDARTAVLAAGGLLLHSGGAYAEPRSGLASLGWILQTVGLAVLAMAFGYSQEAWPDGSVGAVIVGVLSLSVPVVLLPLAVRRGSPTMAAVNGALGYVFLLLFLLRAVDLDVAESLWILDAVALAAIGILTQRVARSAPSDGSAWELGSLLASLYAGLVLVFFTSLEHMPSDAAAFPIDAWLVGLAALTLWGIHRAPEHLRRDWYEDNLALVVLLAIPMSFWTFLEPLDAGVGVTAAGVAGPGVAALAYGLRWDARRVVIAGCLSVIVAAWYLGVEAGGGLGVVGALVFTGALLLWVSSRLGGEAGDLAG